MHPSKSLAHKISQKLGQNPSKVHSHFGAELTQGKKSTTNIKVPLVFAGVMVPSFGTQSVT